MTSGHDITFAPRTIARARALRARHARRILASATRRIGRSLRDIVDRIVRDRLHLRELTLLMHADQRMLADIGLTRHDVIAALESRSWLHRHDALRAAGLRRDEAMAAARMKRSALPREDAPSLAPDLPRATVTSNFR